MKGPKVYTKSYQKIFNTAVKGLASQDFERCTDNLGCRLNGPGGTHCALGWLMPYQRTSMVGFSTRQFSSLARKYGVPESDLEDFLNRLQDAHDFGPIPEVMKFRLRSVAAQYGLKLPKVLTK